MSAAWLMNCLRSAGLIKTWPKPPRVQVFCQDHRLSVVPDTTDQDAIDAAFHVVEFKKRKAAE